jgi:pilus assembly protein CpaB
MGRRLIAIIVAALVALLGVVAVLLYARGAESRAVAGQQPVEVFIAKQPVPSGTVLKDAVRTGLIVKTPVAAKGVPEGVLTEVTDSNSNLLAVSDINAGEFVMTARFGTTPVGTKAIEVPSGQVAVSVSLADPARVGTFVTPGSRVVLYTTMDAAADAKGAPAGPVTRVLLDDLLVIAMGQASLTPAPAAEGEQAPAPAEAGALLTVAVTPADAAKLVHGIQTGRLYAALRGSDAKVDLGQAVTAQSLFAAK